MQYCGDVSLMKIALFICGLLPHCTLLDLIPCQ
jgi:hypothetical protein